MLQASPLTIPSLDCSALAPDVLLLDRGGDVVHMSPALREELGSRERAALKRHPIWSERNQAMVNELLEVAESGGEVERGWCSEGKTGVTQWSAVGLTRPSGGVELVLLTGVRLDTRQQSGYVRPSDLLVSTRHPMWVVDRATCSFLTANEPALALFGDDRRSMRARRLHHLMPWEEVRTALGTLIELRSGLDVCAQWKLRRPGGGPITLEVHLFAVEAWGSPACVIFGRDMSAS